MDHETALKKQISKWPLPFPTIEINKRENINDYLVKDITIENYRHHKNIKMDMIE